MNERGLVAHLLGTPAADAGCEGALALLAEYVEGELKGRNARHLHPTVAEHLRNCPACAEDYHGLTALARRGRSG